MDQISLPDFPSGEAATTLRLGASRAFYEAARTTCSSIRLDAFGTIGDRTLAYVQDWGADGRYLNFGVPINPLPLSLVSSKPFWELLRFTNGLRGESSFLQHTKITPKA